MLRAKISVVTAAFDLPMRAALEAASEMGADGVQFELRREVLPKDYGETALRQLRHHLRELGLTISSANFPLRHPLADPARLEERVQALRMSITFAAQLQAPTLTLRTGGIPDDSEPDAREDLKSVLRDLAAVGNRVGVTLALLPSGDSAEEVRGLLREITTGPVAVVADFAGWLLHEQDPIRQFRELHDFVGLVEVRDAVRDVDGSGREVEVGRGELDWDHLAALLDEAAYAGWLNVNRTTGSDRPGDIRRAVRYMRAVLPVG